MLLILVPKKNFGQLSVRLISSLCFSCISSLTSRLCNQCLCHLCGNLAVLWWRDHSSRLAVILTRRFRCLSMSAAVPLLLLWVAKFHVCFRLESFASVAFVIQLHVRLFASRAISWIENFKRLPFPNRSPILFLSYFKMYTLTGIDVPCRVWKIWTEAIPNVFLEGIMRKS